MARCSPSNRYRAQPRRRPDHQGPVQAGPDGEGGRYPREIDPRPYQAALDQARAKKAQDEATLKNARLNLDRSLSLAKKDYATQQQVDAQQAMVDQLIAQIQGDQAAIDNAQTQLSYTVIKSPLSGRAGFRLVDPGNIVHAADQNGIVTIVQLQPISVVFTAPEENVPLINKALEEGTAVPVEALSSDGLRTLAKGSSPASTTRSIRRAAPSA